MASSPTAKVKCKPYFKLRSQTPRFQPKSTVSAELAAPPAPWQVPSLCAAYNWPTGLAGQRSHRDRGTRRRLGPVRHGRVLPGPEPARRRRSPTCRSTAPRTAPTRAWAPSNDADYEVALGHPGCGRRVLRRHGAAAPPSACTGRRTSLRRCRRPPRMDATCAAISWGADEAIWGNDAGPADGTAAATATGRGHGRLRRLRRQRLQRRRLHSGQRGRARIVPARGRLRRNIQDVERRDRVERQPRPDQWRRHRRRVLHHLSGAIWQIERAASTYRNHRRHRTHGAGRGRATPTPTPATTYTSTEREPWWVERARWRLCMQGCSRRSAPSWAL